MKALLLLCALGLVLPACFDSSSSGGATGVSAIGDAGAPALDGGRVEAPDVVTTGPTTADAAATPAGTPDATDPADTNVEPRQPVTAACLELGDECWSDGTCCGGFCTYSGFDYIPGACSEPQPDGTLCLGDSWCESGACVSGVCADGQCLGAGNLCWSSGDCCTGFCTQENAVYIQGFCASPQPLGSPCQADSACAEGTCIDGLCRDMPCRNGECPAPECDGLGDVCWGNEECCTGFCTYFGFDYTPGTCQSRLPNGSYCLGEAWCQSGACIDSQCVSKGCFAEGEGCFGGDSCCSGMCTWNGFSTTPGSCSVPQPKGAPCVADTWCTSGNCGDGLCQDPAPDPSFGWIYHQVIEPRGCTTAVCHGSPASSLPMPDAQLAYASLVGAPSSDEWCMPIRVVPGSPEESLLYNRVRPIDADDTVPWCGPKMPLGSQGLPPADAELIRLWIASGAAP